MKNYAKIILYAYPLLKTVEKDYEEHIANRALLSYDGRWTAEKTAEYLAEEILEMRRLERLKGKVEEVLRKLTDVERTLVAVRYFGKGKKLKELLNKKDDPLHRGGWTERSYFRRQQRLGERLGELFVLVGLTEEVFEREFAKIDIMQKVQEWLRGRNELQAEFCIAMGDL